MKALTIKQPWLWTITDSTKRVENRTWKPPYSMIGQRIALHASARIEQSEMIACRRICLDPLPRSMDLTTGAIVATAIIRGYVVVDEHGDVTEQSRNAADYEPRTDFWFFGPVGWLLADVRKLPTPIPCKGALRLWDVSVLVQAQIEVQP